MSNVKSMHDALEPRLSPIIVVLVGLPASGKSTLSQAYFHNYAVLDTDDYIMAKAKQAEKLYHEVWKEEYPNALKQVNERFYSWHRSRANILWDQTNLTPKSRRRALSQVCSDYWKVAVYLEIDEGLRQARLAQRAHTGKIIPPEDDAKMFERYVRPTVEEGFDRVINGNDLQWGLIY